MPDIFFTSDTHFGHANIIHLANRPFADVDAMDAALIENWNARIGPKDSVYHLGDFCMGSGVPARDYVKRLNGKIHLIAGNHDDKTVRDSADSFASVSLMKEISVENQKIVLFHYPMREWHKSWRGSWHLYGHVHGRLDDVEYSKSLDVGVDSHDYRPLAFEDVATILRGRQDFPSFAKPEG